jgi:hypothetical protein
MPCKQKTDRNRHPVTRREKDRRQLHDQREEVRFEPGTPNRRQIINRRSSDADPWEEGSQED